MPTTFGSANIKNYPDMPEAKVVEDGIKMSSICDIWGMQENDPREDDEAIDAALGDRWGKVGGGTNLPIWFKRDKFRCLGFRIVNMGWVHNELDLVAKPRLVAIAHFKYVPRANIEFSYVNNHLIAGGKNEGSDNPARAAQWEYEWGLVQRIVTAEKKIRKTIVGGDFNNPRLLKPTRGFDWWVNDGIDYMGATRSGGFDIKVSSSGHVGLNSDHDGRIATVNFVKP